MRFGLHTAIRPAIYDGDTPRNQRAAIRKRSNLILTNPDMLHVGILPHHESWDELLANLAFVVVDEAHVYRGVFGSHVANVLRRLRRAAAIHGTEPRFLLASATIANPVELATQLTGLPDFYLVDDDTAPRPERRTVMWNPPLLDEDLGVRGSALYEAAEVFSELIRAGARTICFMKSRKGIELILKHARDRLDPELAERVAPYRAGYTPAQRQDIQRRLTAGELLGVVATDALELGIDIGELDAAICVTFPGTVSSLRQMWGRAGRRERGLAVYIAGEDALDQFFCRHPDEFLERPVEAAILDPENPQIYAEHLVCAAHEAPLSDADAPFLGADWRSVRRGARRGRLPARAGDRASSRAAPTTIPAARVALRTASADNFVLLDGSSGEVLGTIEAVRAYGTVHPGAIYLHMGRSYHVLDLDLASRRALLEPFSGDYFTQTKRETMTYIERLHEQRETHGVTLSYGAVVYSETVVGFQRKHLQDHTVIDFNGLELPTVEFETRALWYELDELIDGEPFPLGAPARRTACARARPDRRPAADRDVRPLGHRGALDERPPADRRPGDLHLRRSPRGGRDHAPRATTASTRLVDDAKRLIAECPCKAGCPSCVQSPKCGNLNEPLSKRGALELLGRMTG